MQTINDNLVKSEKVKKFLQSTNSEFKFKTFKSGRHYLMDGEQRELAEDILTNWIFGIIKNASPLTKINKIKNSKFEKMTRTRFLGILLLFMFYIKGFKLLFN